MQPQSPAAAEPAPAAPVTQSAAPAGEPRTESAVAEAAPVAAVEPVVPLTQPPARPGSRREPPAVAALIDRMIQQRLDAAKVPASPRASDEEFLRRAYLHIIGRIPPHEKVLPFLNSRDPDKRAKLIDELLASPQYGEYFGTIWENLLVPKEGRYNGYTALRKWFAEGFNKGRGWDKIVTELLTAEGETEKNPAAGWYVAHRDDGQPSPNRLVAITSTLFMGVNLGCAECHDHKLRRDVSQEDFWSMAAFFSHIREEEHGKLQFSQSAKGVTKGWVISETDGPKGWMPGRVMHPLPLEGARIIIPDITDPKNNLGTVVAKYFQGESPKLGAKGPYRPALASWMTSAENKFFSRAAVNRLWAHHFGRGLVNPLDQMFADNPPSHPELLQLLADEFAASGFDLKHLIRCICNSQTYQRTSKPLADNATDVALFSHMAVQVLSPDALKNSFAVVLGAEPKTGQVGRNALSFSDFFDTKPEGSEDTSDLTHGMPQYLLLMNTGITNVAGRPFPPVFAKVTATGSREQVIENLFLAILARRPTPAEMKRMSDYVARKGTPQQGYAGVYWALLNSTEFMVNH